MRTPTTLALGILALSGLVAASAPHAFAPQSDRVELWQQVEVIRTAHGVPHIRADNLRAAGYALAWVQCEDYGDRTPMNLVGARGWAARFEGRDAIDDDFEALRAYDRAVETYHLLEQATRDVYDGFAAGVNRYIELNREEFPPGMPDDFSGYDVAALYVGRGPSAARIRRFRQELESPAAAAGPGELAPAPNPEDGSNAWAFAPSRTRSGNAILLRNPHLSWTAGYYEAHMTVAGVVDFYGDFRIGGPFDTVGGFNRDLGWATTDNRTGDLTEMYALALDPAKPDHYLLDGASLPLVRHTRTVEFLTDDGDYSSETRESWSTPVGPVVHRTNDTAYVAKTAGDLEFRAGEQWLRMMRARSFGEWTAAMRMRALVGSSFTYADRAGNIIYLWNAALPLLPHEQGAAATPAHETGDMWTGYVPFEALPQLRNPKGGYLHNENDSPHFTNVREEIPTAYAYPNIEPPRLRLRSQHAIELIDNNDRVSLEDVVRLKHSYRMLLADRVKPDLIEAVGNAQPAGEVAEALALLEQWDNTAASDTRGSVLFSIWWSRYTDARPDEEPFAVEWSEAEPLETPRGLADPAVAAEAFAWAVEETSREYGRIDVPWGDVHRVRRGSVDVPVGGCAGALGCIRVLGFTRDEADGRLVATTGDAWVLAVEFDDDPRAYSVLAYGQSPDPESPWHADQVEMFARGELKPVAFTERDVDAQAVMRYRPGADVASTSLPQESASRRGSDEAR